MNQIIESIVELQCAGPRTIAYQSWPPPWLLTPSPAHTDKADDVAASTSIPVAPVVIPSPDCRAVLPHWPDEWREMWGIRANQLEDEGLDWRSAESRAFDEISARVGAQP